jgi:hypothetical protein
MPAYHQLCLKDLLTSRGTILTSDAKVVVDSSRTDSSGSLILPSIGTIKNST